jgi:non-specific serine/threonine protein kinase
VGKTRLALRVARQLQRAFPDGVWLVELGTLQDESLVGRTVAEVLGLPEYSSREPVAVLRDFLANKQLLLVLDNCEHLLEASASLAAGLLPAAPGLRVLATSREPLGIGGEQEFPVSPLSLPRVESAPVDGVAARRFEALALFEERASAVLPGFALTSDNEQMVARLCQGLDGLPLAIELAAVRIRTLSVQQILARLEDRFRLLTAGNRAAPARHQTLRAAVEWSFDLCSELERTLWARLSVFAGEFDLDAAEAVCAGGSLTARDVLDGVTGLVDKSILLRGQDGTRARYRMLDTIRSYGRERLDGSADALEIRHRFRDYYLWLAEQAEADWFGPRQPEWLDRVGAEQPNVWAALDFCLTEPGEARSGLRMAGALWWYWIGRVRDGRHWLDRALALDTEPSRERAKALWVDGWITINQGDLPLALPVLEECADLAQRLDDRTALAYATQWTGRLKTLQNRLTDALGLLQKALDWHREAGDLNSVNILAMYHLAWTAGLLGDTERAIALCDECVAICEASGERWTRSWALWYLGFIRWRQGQLEQASTHALESLQLKHPLRDQLGIPFCVELLAWVATTRGNGEHAAVLFGISETLWQAIGGSPLFDSAQLLDRREECRARASEILGQRAFEVAAQRGRQLTFDEAIAYALGEDRLAPAPSKPSRQQLTRREREVAELVAQGHSNKEIAANLVIAQRTAESHVEHILTKLGFASRTQIAMWMADQRNGKVDD